MSGLLKNNWVVGLAALVSIAGCSGSGGGGGSGSSGSASTAYGTSTGTVTSGSGGGAATVNPGSPTTGNLGLGRAYHTATTLPSGAVFVAGGVDAAGQALNLTALVTPTAVTLGPTLFTARFNHTATLLGNGMILLAGGETGSLSGSSTLQSTELYDPAANAVLRGPNLTVARTEHFAAIYGPIGSQFVLIAGGSSNNGLAALDTAEIYNVTTNSTGPLANNPTAARMGGSAGLMDDGTIFIGGGTNSLGAAGSEIFDPSNNSFTSVAMTTPVTGAAFVTNGSEALLAGGQSSSALIEATSSVYEAATHAISSGPLLSIARLDASASLVNGSQVLVIGGRTATGVSGAVDVFGGPTIIGSTVSTATSLVTARYGHTANVLPTGQVLVIGGFDGTATPLASIEVVTVATTTVAGSTASTGSLPPATQGVPISITPVPSTSTIPAAASNSTGSLISGLLGSLLGNILGTGGSSSNAGLSPSIASVNPTTASGPAGTIVVIQATGIGAYLSVALDNGTGNPIFLSNPECTAYTNGSSVQVSWTVPVGTAPGTYNVDLITSSYSTAGSPAAMAQAQFTVQ